MSKEQANEFLKKVSNDKITADKFKQAFRETMVKMGKETGFKFSREDLEQALIEMKAEIPEGELKGVAAAGWFTHPCVPHG